VQGNLQVQYALCEDGLTNLAIVNQFGQEVRSLVVDKYQKIGKYDISIDLSLLAPGIYHCLLNSGHGIVSMKFVVLR